VEDREYKYDVAFSFVAEDETVAAAINDLLQDRMSTFLYSERQSEIACTDGEESFAKVFTEESRIVVILYRNTWGQTKWTRIEETAIRNRAYDQSYDFVTFIPTEQGVPLPKWLPKTYLWVNLDRWGIEGAASVIESRVQEAGGSPREESVADLAARHRRRKDFEEERKQFLKSGDGVNSALTEAEAVHQAIQEMVAEAQRAGLELTIRDLDKGIEVTADEGFLGVHWRMQYADSLEYARLVVQLWDVDPSFQYAFEPTSIREEYYLFDMDSSRAVGWRTKDSDKLISSRQLVSDWLKTLIESPLKDYKPKRDY
jgi:hypothetical protein